MAKLAKSTAELLSCSNTETLLKLAVLLARETTGLERLTIVEAAGEYVRHTYGVSLSGEIVDQQYLSYKKPPGWDDAFGRVLERHENWLACEAELWEHTETRHEAIGLGWCVRTPIPTRSQRRLYMFNDAAISHAPLDPGLQELVAIYCSQIGAIADRISTDEALRQSEGRYRDLIDNINDVLLSLDHLGTITFVSQRAKDVFGYHPTDLIGHNILEFTHPDDADKISTNFQLILSGKSIQATGYRLFDSQGATRWVQASSRAIKNKTQCGLRVVISDISQQHVQSEHTRRLAAGLEQSSDLIAITDPFGRIEYVNPAFEKITGYACDEVLGQNPRMLKSGHHPDSHYKEMWDHLTTGQAWKGHFVNRKKDGTLFEEDVVISPIYDETGTLQSYVASGRDVTQQMEMEQQLRQSQKMEAVGKLAGGIAHDFNNLLMVIINSAQFIEDDLPAASEARNDLQELMHAANRAADLTKQMLAFSRQQPIRLKTESINRVVFQTLEMLKRLIGEDIAIEFQPAEGLPDIRIDAGQIGQVITNLAVNARDAMPGGGRLLLQTGVRYLDKTYSSELIQPENFKDGTYTYLTVSDSGTGMPPEILQHVFEPFFTTKGVGQGTGLGLSTVFGIITQHRGFIQVYSRPDFGTTFQLFLPEAVEEPTPETAEAPKSNLPTGNETILLVEDEVGVRRIAAGLLSRLGYHILEAGNGNEAQAALEHAKNPPDLLIIDVVLKDLKGRELAALINRLVPNIKCLFISGYPETHLHFKKLLHHGDPFLPKPFSRETLARAVRSVLES